MLADFYIPKLSNDMKITVQKNHLVGQILYRSLVPSKKHGVNATPRMRLKYNFNYSTFDFIENGRNFGPNCLTKFPFKFFIMKIKKKIFGKNFDFELPRYTDGKSKFSRVQQLYYNCNGFLRRCFFWSIPIGW